MTIEHGDWKHLQRGCDGGDYESPFETQLKVHNGNKSKKVQNLVLLIVSRLFIKFGVIKLLF